MRTLLVIIAVLGLAAQLDAQSITNRDRDTVSVDFKDTSVRKILGDVAECFGKRIVLPDDLQGATSIKLRDVTWRQIYQVVLSPLGYDYVERESEIAVLTREEIDRLPPERRRVEVFFQRPAELAEYLSRISKQKITIEPADNAVNLIGHPRAVSYAAAAIEGVDFPDVRLNRFPRKPYFPSPIPKLPAPKDSEWIEAPEHQDAASTEVIILRWVDCVAVKAVVEREYPSAMKVLIDYRSNALVVTDKPPMLRKIAALAEYLDDKRWYIVPPQVPNQPPKPTAASRDSS